MTVAFPSIPSAGTGAILVTADHRFLMQLRDDEPHVALRGYWGVFGGEVEEGEDAAVCMKRELEEELEFTAPSITPFFTSANDYSLINAAVRCKFFFIVPITEADVSGMRLHEGEAMRLLSYPELCQLSPLVPLDFYAIHLYLQREEFSRLINPASSGLTAG